MSRTDDQLRNALRPVDPGADFTQRVLERVANAPRDATDPPEPPVAMPRGGRAPAWLPMALAASLVFAAVGAHYWQQQAERAAGLEAREQLLEALRVTSDKLDLAYDGVNAHTETENAGA